MNEAAAFDAKSFLRGTGGKSAQCFPIQPARDADIPSAGAADFVGEPHARREIADPAMILGHEICAHRQAQFPQTASVGFYRRDKRRAVRAFQGSAALGRVLGAMGGVAQAEEKLAKLADRARHAA